jgi:hypothetical protein
MAERSFMVLSERTAAVAPVAGIKSIAFGNRPGLPSVRSQAHQISDKVQSNTISVKLGDNIVHFDLKGATHKGVPTPHVQISRPNTNPNTGQTYFNKDQKFVAPMTQEDINFLKDMGY